MNTKQGVGRSKQQMDGSCGLVTLARELNIASFIGKSSCWQRQENYIVLLLLLTGIKTKGT